MHRRANSGSGDKDGIGFIRCVDGQQPQIDEVWTFGEDSVTSEVHLTARVDVGSGFVGEFATDYLTPNWRRVPMFGRNSINESVEWIGVPDFLSKYGPSSTLNLLDPYDSWGDRGSSTNPNWGSSSGGHSDVVSILWNRPARVLSVYHRRIFENTRSAARCACDDILMEKRTYRIQSPSTCCNPIHNRFITRGDDCWNY